MARKTLVGGTAYDTKGGRCLVDGTAYSIKKGRTLVDAVGYDVSFSQTKIVTITGTTNSYTYVQIGGVSYRDAATLEVDVGEEIYCQAAVTSMMIQSIITVNGAEVAKGTGTQTYTYTVSDADIDIVLGIGSISITEE